MKKDKIIGIIIFLAGVVGILLTMQIPNPNLTQDPGPRLFPNFGSYMLVICGIGIFFKSNGKEEKGKPFLTTEGWKRIMLLAGLLVIYALGLTFVGFLITTPIMVYVLLKILSGNIKVSLLNGAVFSVIVTASIYFVFEKMLNVLLPAGNIF